LSPVQLQGRRKNRQPNHSRHDARRSQAQQIANPTALTHIRAATFGQNFFTT
jgi:hypothetical protein